MMKKMLALAMVFGAVLVVSPVLANDEFRAMNQVSAVQLTDSELAQVEGAALLNLNLCAACFNLATVTQTNIGVALLGKVSQKNTSFVKQILAQPQIVP